MKKVKRLVGGAGTYTVDGQEKTRWFPMGTLFIRTTATSSSSSTPFLWALILMVGSTFSTLTTTPNRPQRPSLQPLLQPTKIYPSDDRGRGGPDHAAADSQGHAPEAAAPPPPVEYVDTSEPFPSVRDVSYDPADIGSAGKDGTGNTRYIAVRKGGINVLGMTMGDIVDGRINFGVTASQITGADLRLWISAQPDSIRVSEACSYVGYAESSLFAAVVATLPAQSGRQVLHQHSGLLVEALTITTAPTRRHDGCGRRSHRDRG